MGWSQVSGIITNAERTMTELLFKGKEFVYSHHLAVPYRLLLPDAGRLVGTPDLGSVVGGGGGG